MDNSSDGPSSQIASDDNNNGDGPLSDSKGVVGGLGSLHFCQGSEGPWRTTVLRDGSRVAERMSIRPSAYKTSHNVIPVE